MEACLQLGLFNVMSCPLSFLMISLLDLGFNRKLQLFHRQKFYSQKTSDKNVFLCFTSLSYTS